MKGYHKIIVTDRQCLIDIAMQEYGCYEGLFVLLRDNADTLTAIHYVPEPGSELLIRDIVPKLTENNRAIVSDVKRFKRAIVSGSEYVPEETGYVITAYWDNDNYTSDLKTG